MDKEVWGDYSPIGGRNGQREMGQNTNTEATRQPEKGQASEEAKRPVLSLRFNFQKG